MNRAPRRPVQISLFEQETMSPDQAAEYLRISRDTVVRMLEAGILRGYRHTPNGWWKVLRNSVIEHERKLAAQADYQPGNEGSRG